MSNKSVMEIECMYCRKPMGSKDGGGVTGTTSSICRECWAERWPEIPYPEDDSQPVESPDVRCKDCANMGVLTVPLIDLHYKASFDPIFTGGAKPSSPTYFRTPYCQKIDAIVDVSAVRKCGCFIYGKGVYHLVSTGR